MTTTTTTSAGPNGSTPGVLGGTDLAIAATGLRKDFGSVHAVRGIDLEIRQGEIVAFLGPNGAGKTTTIDMILGLSDPTAGTVTVLGQSPRSAIAHGLVAAVMQTAGLLKDISVRETLELTGSLFVHHVSVDGVMKRAGISDIGDRRVNKCSGGQQQRLRFAMALLSDPELLILDEPTTGMDVTGRRDFWAAIRQDATRGRTILFATHYLEEADEYADRIILVRQGEIVADGTAAQIKAMAAGRTVRATVPGVTAAQLEAVPAADSVELRGEIVRIHSKDSDAVARYLLTQTDAHDLEIESRGIEDAFIALTADAQDDPTTTTAGETIMTTAVSDAAEPAYAARAERRVPPMGGLNPTLLRIELLRVLRNRRTMIFTLVMPAVFYLIFGVSQSYADQDAGRGNVAAYIMISMAAYGAMIASTGGGAMVATERAQGWSRQLRLTPLSPVVVRVRQAAHRHAARRSRGPRRLRHGCVHQGADGHRRAVGSDGAHRLGRFAGLRGVRPLHGVPAAERERHADHRPRPGHPRLRRRAVRPARGRLDAAEDRAVHPDVRHLVAGPRAAHRATRSSGRG